MMRSWVAGHTGMVGSALVRRLGQEACFTDQRYDLRQEHQAEMALDAVDANRVYLAAARVGGIGANWDNPIGFLTDNMRIGMSVVTAAYDAGVRRLINFGSSCIYPRDAQQPMREEALLTGRLERTNEGYALAKIATLKLVDYYRQRFERNYFSLMPTNLYGPGDTYDAERSHVIPAMILKLERARRSGAGTVSLWGSGRPLREFLFVDDLADAAVLVMETYRGGIGGWLNVGSGEEISIEHLAGAVAKATGYTGRVVWDSSRPDGSPRKLLDSAKIKKLGWSPKVTLEEGLERAVEDFRRREIE
ncbi:MAG: GDP-L-fucose synthase [Gammaproteobacteria bacterium]|nr:GDP-L-fucose synthase [Gammaproteobacteria bacterium]